MSQSWFYQHAGATHGPVSSEQIKELAQKKLLDAHDLIWPEGGNPEGAIPADAALDFSAFPGSAPAEPAANAPEPAPAPPNPSSGSVPDWLDDVAAIEKTASRRTDFLIRPDSPKSPPTLPSAPAAPDYLEDLRLWVGLDAHTSRSIQPVAASPVPLAKPVSETGFDPQTGRIFDPEKFTKWQQQRPAGVQSGVTNGSMLEAFRKARIMLETWIDDGQNRLRITHADVQEIKLHKEIQEILGRFSQYGSTMTAKLERHVEFLVENRRKYYRAAGVK